MSAKPVTLYDAYNRPIPRVGPASGPRHMPQISPWNIARPTLEKHPIAIIQSKFAWGRDAGRELYWTYKLVRGAVNEIARHVGADMTTTFTGEDQDWGNQALAWMRSHDQRIDSRGRGYTAKRLRQDIVRHCLLDGENGILLTRAVNGSPKVQFIHGDFCDTPIHSATGTVLGYEINGNPVSTDDLIWVTLPGFEVQGRGISPVGLAREEWMDLGEWKLNELAGIRAWATRTMKVKNDTGEPITRDFSDDVPTSNTTAPKVTHERLDRAGIEYIRAGEGADVEGFDGLNRPTLSTQEFMSREIREHFFALGWNVFYALDQAGAGGASIRVAADRVRGTAMEYFDYLIAATMRRVDPYRLAVAVQLGELPPPPDTNHFFAFSYDGGREVTADRRYRAQTDQLELELGITTKSRVIASRGGEGDYNTILEQGRNELIRENEARDSVYQDALQRAGGDPGRLAWILKQQPQQSTQAAE